jgi:uncharacterized protein (TIGR02246 family)
MRTGCACGTGGRDPRRGGKLRFRSFSPMPIVDGVAEAAAWCVETLGAEVQRSLPERPSGRSPDPAAAEEADVEDPEAVGRAYVERINDADLDGLLELMPDDYAFVDVDGKVERGRDLMRKGWSGYFSELPNYKIHLSQVVPLGDVVVLIGRTTGSQIPPEVEAEETVIWTAWIRDGLVREWRILYAYTDTVERFLERRPTRSQDEDSAEASG